MADYAIIVAAGTGQRMGHALPKQFHLLDKIPVLMRSLHAFHSCSLEPEIILVLGADWMEYWTDLCYKYRFHVPHSIVEGGQTRFQSVKKGLQYIQDERISDADLAGNACIAVHDGARPLVTSELIEQCYQTAKETGAAAPSIPLTDSIRLLDPVTGGHNPLDRDRVRRIQTPQTFRADLILKAYQESERPEYTDDCSVLESIGVPITLIEGEQTNLKITTSDDLVIAHAYLQQD